MKWHDPYAADGVVHSSWRTAARHDPQVIDGVVYSSWEATSGPDAPSLGDIGRRIYEPSPGHLDAGDRRLRSE